MSQMRKERQENKNDGLVSAVHLPCVIICTFISSRCDTKSHFLNIVYSDLRDV